MDEVRISVFLDAIRAPTLRSSNDARVVFGFPSRCLAKWEGAVESCQRRQIRALSHSVEQTPL